MIVLKLYLVSYMYHVLSPSKTSSNEMILKSIIEFSCKLKIIVHDSISKVYDYMFGVYLFNFIIMYIFLFKLIATIHNFFCHIDDFTIHLWHLNMTLCVKSDVMQKVCHLILHLLYDIFMIFEGLENILLHLTSKWTT